MRRALLGSFALLLATGSPSRGEAAEPAAADAGALPPSLVLTVTPGTGGAPWKLRVENTGDVPVRLAADPRLVVLELSPPAGGAEDASAKNTKKTAGPLRCALPDDARPPTDEGRELVVPGKRSWSATIDPLYYCFGARERAALVTGTSVVARFGWPPPKAKAKGGATPPFVAAPVGAAVGKIAPAKELVGAPFTLGESWVPLPPPKGEEKISLAMQDAVDVGRGADISATVTLANDGDRPITLLFRPGTLAFTVSGPQGSVKCGSPRAVASPIRELFATVGPKGKSSLTVLLDTLCPADTFDEPGVYRVLPQLDTTNASGRAIGIKSWDGEAGGHKPMLLRVRSQRRPSAATRPSLD